jgi:hypothetical protein
MRQRVFLVASVLIIAMSFPRAQTRTADGRCTRLAGAFPLTLCEPVPCS